MLPGRAAAILICIGAIGHGQPGTAVANPREATITITGHGTDRPNQICEGFRLTESQARLFFKKAKPVTSKQLHDQYEYLPCWVEGTITQAGSTSKWKIRPIGIGELRRADGKVQFLGCKNCDSLFR